MLMLVGGCGEGMGESIVCGMGVVGVEGKGVGMSMCGWIVELRSEDEELSATERLVALWVVLGAWVVMLGGLVAAVVVAL